MSKYIWNMVKIIPKKGRILYKFMIMLFSIDILDSFFHLSPDLLNEDQNIKCFLFYVNTLLIFIVS